MRIMNKATGKLYPVTDELREFIADHIEELIDGNRVTGLTFNGRPKRLGLDHKMRFTLTPESWRPQNSSKYIPTIQMAGTETRYLVSEELIRFIVCNLGVLLTGARVEPLTFDGLLDRSLKLDEEMQFILVKAE